MSWHRDLLEHRSLLFTVLTTVAISIGGLVEILPMYSAELGGEPIAEVTPYTPLEVAGRDIYVREGCYNCHSQMVRPFRSETMRYGEWSRAGEYAYDRPFQLGSRRIGPDLARVGGKYPDRWHYDHMLDPRELEPRSIMPAYPWLFEDKVELDDVTASVDALRTLGAEYPEDLDVGVEIDRQGGEIVGRLNEMGVEKVESDDEIVALIAYLQRLGVDGRKSLDASSDSSEVTE